MTSIRRGDPPPERPKRGNIVQVISEFREEINFAMDVLLGRIEPPYDAGVATLMEVADAYFARASEMEIVILGLERNGRVSRGDAAYKFRTGELRSFKELAKNSGELGSRRITMEQMRQSSEMRGIDSTRRGRGTSGA